MACFTNYLLLCDISDYFNEDIQLKICVSSGNNILHDGVNKGCSHDGKKKNHVF